MVLVTQLVTIVKYVSGTFFFQPTFNINTRSGFPGP